MPETSFLISHEHWGSNVDVVADSTVDSITLLAEDFNLRNSPPPPLHASEQGQRRKS